MRITIRELEALRDIFAGMPVEERDVDEDEDTLEEQIVTLAAQLKASQRANDINRAEATAAGDLRHELNLLKKENERLRKGGAAQPSALKTISDQVMAMNASRYRQSGAEEEREACAKLAESNTTGTPWEIAADIRARGQPKEPLSGPEVEF